MPKIVWFRNSAMASPNTGAAMKNTSQMTLFLIAVRKLSSHRTIYS